jgi:hypothetical protein
MNRKLKSLALVASFALVTGTTAAQAAPTRASPRAVTKVIVETADAGSSYSSTLTIDLDQPVPNDAARSMIKKVGGTLDSYSVSGGVARSTASLTSTVRPDAAAPAHNLSSVQPMGQPAGAQLLCDQDYAFSDSNGTYTIQRACTSSSAPWGYKLSTGLQAIIVSTVSESGMFWARNGVTQPLQAPHPGVSKNYQFHGTYSGCPAGTHVAYSDTFTFRVSGGSGNVQIHGDFTLTGNRPCGPGGPRLVG